MAEADTKTVKELNQRTKALEQELEERQDKQIVS